MGLHRPISGLFTLYNHPDGWADWETVQVPYLIELYKAALETMQRLGAIVSQGTERAAYCNHDVLRQEDLVYYREKAEAGLYSFLGLLGRSTHPIFGSPGGPNADPWLTEPYPPTPEHPEYGCPWKPNDTMPGIMAVEQELAWKFNDPDHGMCYVSDWYLGNDNPPLFCPMSATARAMAVWGAFHSSWAWAFPHDPDLGLGNKYMIRDLTPSLYYLMAQPRTTPISDTETSDPADYIPCSNPHLQTGGHDLVNTPNTLQGWMHGVRLMIEEFLAVLHAYDVTWIGNWGDESGFDRWKDNYYDQDGLPDKSDSLALLIDGFWLEAGTDGNWSGHGNTSGGTPYTYGTDKHTWENGTAKGFVDKVRSLLGWSASDCALKISTGTSLDIWNFPGDTNWYDLADTRLAVGRALEIGITYHTPHSYHYGHPCPITGQMYNVADVYPQNTEFKYVHPYHVLLCMMTWMEYHSGILGDENIGGGVRKYYEEKEGIRNTGRYESFSPVTGESWSGFNADGIYVRHPDGDKSFVAPATTSFSMPIPAGRDFVSVTACKRSVLFQGTAKEVEAHLFEPDYDAINDWEPNEADSVLTYTGPLPVGAYQRGYIVEWTQEQQNDPPDPPAIGMDRD